MIAAGYALYGSATVIVLSFGDAPSMFMLGLFCIIPPNERIPLYKNVKPYQIQILVNLFLLSLQ